MQMRCLPLAIACLLLSMAGPAVGQPDGADIQIRDGTVVATAADYEMDGTMWVAFTRLDDSCTYLYRSTDHGLGWEYRAALGGSGMVLDRLGLVVGEGESSFVHLFYLSPYDNGDLYELRISPDGSSMITFPVHTGPDTIREFAVCRDYTGSNYWLYAVTSNPGSQSPRALSFFRSSTYGRTWTPMMSGPSVCRDLHLAAGAGSYLYFTARAGDTLVRITNSLYLDPAHWVNANWTPLNDEILDPVTAPAFTTPESSTTVWCVWSQNFNNSGDWDVKYSWTTDAGGNWSTPNYLAGSTSADEGFPDVRNYSNLGNQYVNASYISDDNVYRSVYRRYAQASTPDQWSDTLRINQNSAGTGSEIRPKLCYTPGGPFSGAGCVFVGAGLNGCWWNGPYPSGAEDNPDSGVLAMRLSVEPSIGRGPFRIHASSPALLTVHDRAGRLVRELMLGRDGAATWNGRDAGGRSLAGGVYFVRLVTDGELATEKLVLQR